MCIFSVFFSTFENNSIYLLPGSSLLIYQYNTVIGLRLPVEFSGRNVFRSNVGGGVNMNHAKLTISGRLEFLHNRNGTLGGAIRLGELALVSSCDYCCECSVQV